MGKTIYLSKPQSTSLLYKSYLLNFAVYSGTPYNPDKMEITSVTYEFRCQILNNPNTFGFTSTGNQNEDDLVTNQIKTNYYSSDQNTYFTDSITGISSNFKHTSFKGKIEKMPSLFTNNGQNFQVYFTQFDRSTTNTSSAKIHDYSKTGDENIADYIRSNAWVCTVEWEYIPQPPTPPTKIGTSQNNLGVNADFLGAQTLKLYWSGATGGSDENGNDISIKNYKITRVGTGESWVSYGTNYNFPCHPELWGEYTYQISTINEDGASSDAYLSITISTYYTSPTKPTDVKIDGVSVAYIGEKDVPSSLKLTWKPGTNGVNNIIKEYGIYKDNADEPMATITCDSSSVSYSYTLENPGTSIYKVSSIGTVNNTEVIGDAAEIRIIDAPASPTPVESSIVSMDDTIILAWRSISHNSAQGNLSYILSESNKILKEGYFTSYSYNTSNAESNTPINFSIKARINAKNGGYIDSNDSIITYTKIGLFSFPTDDNGKSTFWVGLAETTGDDSPEALNKDVFSKVSVAWASLIEADTAPGRTSFTYELQYRLSTTSNWITLINTDNTAYFGADISTAEEGAEIGFQVVATDNYGLSLTSPILTATKIKRPLITKVSASNISYAYFQANFSIQGQVENEDINYNIYLKYNGINCAIANTEAKIENNVLEINSFNRGLNISIAGKAAETGWSGLYEDVINNKISMPYISFVVEASYDKFPGCKTVQESATFQANYRKAPVRKENNLATFNITKISALSNTGAYYNPNDTFKATLATNNFYWEDAAGGIAGGEIAYRIISSYSKKSYNFDQPIVVPSVTKDELVTFTMEATVTYSDGAITYKYSENQPSITIAKWSVEQTYIQDFTKVQNGYEGYLVLPDNLCSSLTRGNLNLLVFTTNFNDKVTNGSSISDGIPEGAMKDDITFYYDKNSNGSWTSIGDWNIAGSTLRNLSGTNNRKIKFTITSIETSCNFFIETTWTNTSGHSLIITTPTVSHITAAADFAIRKGRIGVNIGENFGKEGSNIGLSTVEINHSSDIQANGNILTLDGSKGCGAFICLRGTNGIQGTITQDTVNNQFIFSDNFKVGSNYSLPTASADTLGGVKIGNGIDIDGDGRISVKITEYILPTASKDVLGGVTTTSTVINSSGYTACPIINGVVYYKETTSPEINYPVTSVNGKTGIVVLQAQDIEGFSTVATSGSYNDLEDKPTIPTVNYPVTSVNGQTGTVALTHLDVGAAYKNHTHNLSELNGVATFRLEGTTLYITTNTVAG